MSTGGMHMESWPPRHRITVHDYHRMGEIGLFPPDARVELIEGEIIDMAPLGNDHQSIVDQLNRQLVTAVGERAIVRVQGSIRLSQWSEPGPDLVLLATAAIVAAASLRRRRIASRSSESGSVLMTTPVAIVRGVSGGPVRQA